MKCLAITDLFINKEMMEKGLESFKSQGIDITIKDWNHKDLEELQRDNIKLETEGSEAVRLPKEILNEIDQFDIVITQFAPIGIEAIEKAKKLKILGVLRAGTENVNVDYAKKKDIKVYNTIGRSATSVSEFTVGMILAESRNISRANQSLKKGLWRKHYPNGFLSPDLKESTVGLIGYGSIGRKVADLLRPFGTKIMFYDEYYSGKSRDEKVDLKCLLENSDIVSMHYRLTEGTRNMLSLKDFKIMKPTAILINTARSGLICENDLIKALDESLIAGAAIDVFDHEPLPQDHPYLTMDNVTITPHIAGSTIGNFSDSPKILSKVIIEEINIEEVS